MKVVPTRRLLAAWEAGMTRSHAGRALALLAATPPGADVPDSGEEDHEAAIGRLAELSIGQRDVRLLGLRRSTFGPSVEAVVSCLSCEARLEVGFDLRQIDGGGSLASAPDQPLSVTSGAYEIEFRLPTSRDLAELDEAVDTPAAKRIALLGRCVRTARRQGTTIDVGALPEALCQLIEQRMAEADGQAWVQLDVRCPDCRHHWRAGFDIAAFFWAEVDQWARSLLRDVHTLASAYGWREADILALSPARRRCYLDLVRQ